MEVCDELSIGAAREAAAALDPIACSQSWFRDVFLCNNLIVLFDGFIFNDLL